MTLLFDHLSHGCPQTQTAPETPILPTVLVVHGDSFATAESPPSGHRHGATLARGLSNFLHAQRLTPHLLPGCCFFGDPARASMPEVPCLTYTLAPKSPFCIDPCVSTGLCVLCLIFTVLGDVSHLQLTEEKTGKQSSCLQLHRRLRLDRLAAELSLLCQCSVSPLQ